MVVTGSIQFQVIYIKQVVDLGLFIQLVSISYLLEFSAERIKGHDEE